MAIDWRPAALISLRTAGTAKAEYAGLECATCASIYRMDWAPEGKSPKDFMRAVNASTDAQNKHLRRVAEYAAEDPAESSRAKVRRLRGALDTTVEVQKDGAPERRQGLNDHK